MRGAESPNRLLVFGLALTLGGSAACQPPAATDASAPAADPVARGEYLVSVLDCDACHTPKNFTERGPELDMSRRLSGHPDGEMTPATLSDGWDAATNPDLTAWSGPWGISYAANLTPHETTGMSIWTDEMFIKMMRTGRHMGAARPLLPPMPFVAYANLPDEDLSAILTYLKTLPPIDNQVPLPTPPRQ